MNILLASYYYKPHIGGVENSLTNLLIEYNKLGHNCIIISSDKGLEKKLRLPEYEKFNDFTIYRFRHFEPINPFFYPLASFVEFFRICSLLKKLPKIDSVIARNHLLAFATKYVGLRTNYLLPGVVIKQDMLEFKYIDKNKALYRRVFEIYRKYTITMVQHQIQKYALKRVDGIFVFSKIMQNQMKAISNRSSILVKPGIDKNRFNILGSKEKYKADLDILPHIIVFIIVGRATKHKQFDKAIEAYCNSGINMDSILLVVGDGPELPKLKNLALGRNDVRFMGKTSNVENFYKASDFFIMSSIHETFGQTIIESLACGCIFLGYRSSSKIDTATSEIVNDGVNGWLCETDGLSQLIWEAKNLPQKKLVMNKELRSASTSNDYSWENLAIQLIK